MFWVDVVKVIGEPVLELISSQKFMTQVQHIHRADVHKTLITREKY